VHTRRRPLFKRAVRRALGSSAGALQERPQLLQQLIEVCVCDLCVGVQLRCTILQTLRRARTHTHTSTIDLVQLKMLFQTERLAGGYWHMLRPIWRSRVAAGGENRVAEEVLVQVNIAQIVTGLSSWGFCCCALFCWFSMQSYASRFFLRVGCMRVL